MKFSKLFPMGTDEADEFIQDIVEKGRLDLIEPERFPYLQEVKLLYLGPNGFVTIKKKPREGNWEVMIET